MKKVNVKDVEVSDVEEVKKSNIKTIIVMILICIVSLVGIFFWSTKVRWNAQIEEYYEILYYGQEDIKINNLVGFYHQELEVELKDNEARLMYCDSKYGGNCVTGDFSNSFENLLRNPSIVIDIVVLIDFILLFILLCDKFINKYKVYLLFCLILFYGLFTLGKVVYGIAEYYMLVNDSKYLANSIITYGLETNNEIGFYPVVSYQVEDNDYLIYIDNIVEGKIDDNVGDKLTIYYDKNDSSIATSKRSFNKYILPAAVGFIFVILSIVYLKFFNKKNKQ